MPNLLILGGVGPLGKIVALAALESCAYTRIRVVDKQLPETAYFLDHELDRFRHLEIIQLDLGVQGELDKDVPVIMIIACSLPPPHSLAHHPTHPFTPPRICTDDDGSLLSKAFNLPGDERWDIVVYAYLDTLSLGSNEVRCPCFPLHSSLHPFPSSSSSLSLHSQGKYPLHHEKGQTGRLGFPDLSGRGHDLPNPNGHGQVETFGMKLPLLYTLPPDPLLSHPLSTLTFPFPSPSNGRWGK